MADRDAHLRSGDFFAIEQHPQITFPSTDIRQGGDNLVVTGELTVKGITRPVQVVFAYNGIAKDSFGNTGPDSKAR